MRIESHKLLSQAKPKTTAGKILQFPLTRIVLVALFIGPFLFFHNNVIADALASVTGNIRSILMALDAIVSIGVIMFLYTLYVRFIEKRKTHEMSGKQCVKEWLIGMFISFGLVGIMVLLMAVLGYYGIDQLGSPWIIVDGVFFFGMGAFLQVLAFRLILFKLSEEWLGSWLAFVLIAAVFGIVHIANPNAGLQSTVFLVLGDILLAAAYIYTRRIWMVWGIHWGWNLLQDGVFGMPNSGITDLPSWIQPIVSGPEWITGGPFGIEMSVIATALSLIVGLVMVKKAVEAKQIVSPVWKK